MKFPIKTTVALLVLGVGGGVAYSPVQTWWKARNKPSFRQVEVTRGEIISVVNSTGTVQPVLRVQVGAVVSGPIEALHVGYNDEVEEGELMAEIDPRIYDAAVARDQATLATRLADVERCTALRQQAGNDEQRAIGLREENEDYISDTEMDQFKYNHLSQQAQLAVALAAVAQAEANLLNSQANLEYTKIRSPVAGIVIDQKIEKGQSLASQFQTPELFVVAPNMREKMRIFAAVDEADIGLILQAKDRCQKVQFTVDAYPDDLFEGTIHQVRMNPTTTQNVVTYPVVVESPNPELKLLPGMTANLSFEVDHRKEILKVPNAAMRFFPRTEHVRAEDRGLLDGTGGDDDSEDDAEVGRRSAKQTAEANEKRNRRHVWVVDGEKLKAIEIVTGLSDYKWTEVVSGDLKEGQKLVTGIGPPKSSQ